mmetsp:Transcript_71041/g.82694  ORF Transcript_71041/g.82694 Transcript_71041/m.82694 type:complete len:206 (-) Transcript_71041:154-771(-)|eukprot:CAMPEP_0176424728 /NCGR_PEP_ID=MMETSP0127-20121128/10997_1 /TAXON_ID=938130 /ORGANISM="Platyophrya macrostoma, Strain WH" /LENGTH=205 /DNA_ID=CAMNT_0017805815 /DNA_START=58 /DNA_END=675 /DNA_ORIENTATION=-
MNDTEISTKKEEVDKQGAKIEDEDSSSDDEHGHEHGHKHGPGCGHDHEGEHKDKKQNKGEKKLKKAMTKLGMKPVTDIVRVTLKKSKNFMLYIDDPDVMKSPGAENTYIIFGEAKINDLSGAFSQKEAEKFANPEKAVGKEEKTEKAEGVTKVEETETGPLDETGLDAGAIDSVMSGANVTRNQAIRALRETNGDSVDAIIQLTK